MIWFLGLKGFTFFSTGVYGLELLYTELWNREENLVKLFWGFGRFGGFVASGLMHCNAGGIFWTLRIVVGSDLALSFTKGDFLICFEFFETLSFSIL